MTTPQKFNIDTIGYRYTKLLYLKGDTFSKAHHFWYSRLYLLGPHHNPKETLGLTASMVTSLEIIGDIEESQRIQGDTWPNEWSKLMVWGGFDDLTTFRQQFVLVKTQIYRQQQSATCCFVFVCVGLLFRNRRCKLDEKMILFWFWCVYQHSCLYFLSASDFGVFLGPDVAVTLWKTPISQESSDHDMTEILANPKLCPANPNMAINLHLPDVFLEILLAFLVLWVKRWMLVGGFKCALYFPPEPWGNDPTWRAFVQTGWFNHQLERHNHCTIKIQES